MYSPNVILGVELEVEILNNYQSDSTYHPRNPIFGYRGGVAAHEFYKHGNFARAMEDAGEDFVTVGLDGSLMDGFELRGAPGTLALNKMHWSRIFDNKTFKDLAHGEDVVAGAGRDAGMHVHLSGDPIGPLTLAKMVKFINNPLNKKTIKAIAGRYNTDYCRINTEHKVSDVVALYHTPECPKHRLQKKTRSNTPARQNVIANVGYQIMGIPPRTYHNACWCNECNANRRRQLIPELTEQGVRDWEIRQGYRPQVSYHGTQSVEPNEGICCKGMAKKVDWLRGAIYVTPREGTGICEIRMFKSTTNKERFFANLEFCVALVEFCHEHTPRDMGEDSFRIWLRDMYRRAKYPNLFKHLRDQKLTDGLIPKKETLKELIVNGKATRPSHEFVV